MSHRDSELEHSVEQEWVAHGAKRAADAVLLLMQVGGAVQLQEALECGRVRLRQHGAVTRRAQVRRQRARARYVRFETAITGEVSYYVHDNTKWKFLASVVIII